MNNKRDGKAQARTWEIVDRGFGALLIGVLVVTVAFGVLAFAGMLVGCTPTGDVKWPPEVTFDAARVRGYVDLATPEGVQRVDLGVETVGDGVDGGVRVIGWGIDGDFDASVNGRAQGFKIASANERRADGEWVHCVTAGVVIEYADGTMKATGRPPGLSSECGPAGVEVAAPFLGWDVAFSRATPAVGAVDRAGEEPSADPNRGDSADPVVPPIGD